MAVAEIEMNGQLVDGLTGPENYNITVNLKSKLAGSNDYYEYIVTFNFDTKRIRSEEGHLRSAQK